MGVRSISSIRILAESRDREDVDGMGRDVPSEGTVDPVRVPDVPRRGDGRGGHEGGRGLWDGGQSLKAAGKLT